MKNVTIIVGLLLGGFALAIFCGAARSFAGRVGISSVFYFTALGHFVKKDQMLQMLPPFVPQRTAVVFLSGIFELLIATAIISSSWSRSAGLAACVFLVIATPLNVYSAFRRVDFGGHSAGPRYLAIRLPLQAILFLWIFYFTLR